MSSSYVKEEDLHEDLVFVKLKGVNSVISFKI